MIDKPSKILLLFIVDKAFDDMFKSKRQKQIDINIMRVVNIHRKLELLYYSFFCSASCTVEDKVGDFWKGKKKQ